MSNMLSLSSVFKTEHLRKKILLVLGLIVIYRLGAAVPSPGINYSLIQSQLEQTKSEGVMGLMNMFSGGALLQIAIFALGAIPYITASIMIQLLTQVIPRLEAIKKQGTMGEKTMKKYTRWLTFALALVQASGVAAMARSGQLFNQPGTSYLKEGNMSFILVVATLTAGACVIMWFGEIIDKRGVGNGMSILIFTSIAATLPNGIWSLKATKGWGVFIFVIIVTIVLTALVIFLEQGQRRIPIEYSSRSVGRTIVSGRKTFLPVKLNQSGVIPVIFASSFLALPYMVTQFNPGGKVSAWILGNFSQGKDPLYLVTYFALIVLFSFFYASITFNPREVSDNLRHGGGFVPGVRPGINTEKYFSYISTRLTLPGSMYLAVLAILPLLAMSFMGANQNLPFGGTSLLILVGVALDTVKKIEGEVSQKSYSGFLKT